MRLVCARFIACQQTSRTFDHLSCVCPSNTTTTTTTTPSPISHCIDWHRCYYYAMIAEELGIDPNEWAQRNYRNDFAVLSNVYKLRLLWSPERHLTFSPKVQKRIHMIMLLNRFTDCYLSALPNELLFLLFQWLTALKWTHIRSIAS
jgi:hypothetical protein